MNQKTFIIGTVLASIIFVILLVVFLKKPLVDASEKVGNIPPQLPSEEQPSDTPTTPPTSTPPATFPPGSITPLPPPTFTPPTSALPTATLPLPGTPPSSSSTIPPSSLSTRPEINGLTPLQPGPGLVADFSVPEISSISVTNHNNRTALDSRDTITITFNEKLNPQSIHPQLTYGGHVSGITAGNTGNVTSTLQNEIQLVTIANIVDFAYELHGYRGMSALTQSSDTLALDSTGTILTITLDSTTGGAGGVPLILGYSYQKMYVGTVSAGTVKDVAGNSLKSAQSPTPSGAF